MRFFSLHFVVLYHYNNNKNVKWQNMVNLLLFTFKPMYKNAEYILLLKYNIKIFFITWTTGLCKWTAKNKNERKITKIFIFQPICKNKFYDLCYLFYYFNNNNNIKIVIIHAITTGLCRWTETKIEKLKEAVTSFIPQNIHFLLQMNLNFNMHVKKKIN